MPNLAAPITNYWDQRYADQENQRRFAQLVNQQNDLATRQMLFKSWALKQALAAKNPPLTPEANAALDKYGASLPPSELPAFNAFRAMGKPDLYMKARATALGKPAGTPKMIQTGNTWSAIGPGGSVTPTGLPVPAVKVNPATAEAARQNTLARVMAQYQTATGGISGELAGHLGFKPKPSAQLWIRQHYGPGTEAYLFGGGAAPAASRSVGLPISGPSAPADLPLAVRQKIAASPGPVKVRFNRDGSMHRIQYDPVNKRFVDLGKAS